MATVLFICPDNAGKLQIAAALFNRLANRAKARAVSAGIEPARCVHPAVVLSMLDVDIDVLEEQPTRLTATMQRACSLIVTLGCDLGGEDAASISWRVDDPKGQTIDKVCEIRDEIRGRVISLLEERGWIAR